MGKGNEGEMKRKEGVEKRNLPDFGERERGRGSGTVRRGIDASIRK